MLWSWEPRGSKNENMAPLCPNDKMEFMYGLMNAFVLKSPQGVSNWNHLGTLALRNQRNH
jgi:hypothetical protein